ncbi:MAG: endonuclease [Marmoricola sp.]|nr:endonuclease [Marmoricola sp.]
MSTSSIDASRHPYLRAADQIASAIKDVVGVDPTFMPTRDKAEALLAFSSLASQLEGCRLSLIAAGQDVADRDAARTVAGWLETRTQTDHGPNHRTLQLAEALDRRWHQVARALIEARVNVAQAEVIVRALDELPDDVPDETVRQAEAHLVLEASHFGPTALRRLGRRILEVVAPDVAEDQERQALEHEEQHAARGTSLFSQRLGDGTTRITIRVPDACAARLHAYLEAFTSPRRSLGDAAGLADRVPSYQAKGQAFCALLESLDPRRAPLHGGDATTVMVTVSLETLRSGVGGANLGPDDRISAHEARRLACTAKIIPVVLGAKSEVLDLGRSARLFSPAQRKAMAIRDKHCRAEGCSKPASWCEAHHHKARWSQGGRTDLADGILLCSWHHHRAHDDRYLHEELPNGDVRFSRRR